jgi:hypothetical protein
VLKLQQPKYRLKTQKYTGKQKYVTHEIKVEEVGVKRVPLHKGSDVFITESELRSITTLKAKAGLYISRLADIIFGKEVFDQAVNSNEINLDLFDQEKLKAITSSYFVNVLAFVVKKICSLLGYRSRWRSVCG